MINCLEKIIGKWWGMLVLSVIPFLFALVPILFGDKIFITGDLADLSYPSNFFYQESLIKGESILWNPYVFSGFPTSLSSMIFFSPFFYLFFLIFPSLLAYKLYILLNLTLAFFFFWLLLRDFDLPIKIGFIGALVYIFSQWHLVHDLGIVSALSFLPLLFLIIWRMHQKRNVSLILLGGLLIGWAWVSVHFNWLALSLSAALLFVLFLAWFGPVRNKLSNEASFRKWQFLTSFILMILLGTAIGLFIILPFLNYSSLSARFSGLSYQEMAVGAFNLGDFFRLLLPYFKTSVFDLAASPTTLYLGLIPLFFLIFVFKFQKSSFLIPFFTFLFFLSILISVKYSPLFWLLSKLPVFDSLRGPDRWMFIGSFAGAILSSFGLNYFLERKKENWQKLLLQIFKWITLTLLFISITATLIFHFFRKQFILFAQDYFDKNLYPKTTKLPIEHYHRVIEDIIGELNNLFSVFNPKVFLPLVFILVGYFVLRHFIKSRAIKIKPFLFLVISVITLNFLAVSIFARQTISEDVLLRQPETVKIIKEHNQLIKPEEGQRIFSFMPGFSEYTKLTVPYQPTPEEGFLFQSEMISPNLNLFYHLPSVDCYDNLMSRRMARILSLVGSDRATIGEKLTDLKITLQEKVETLTKRKRLLDLLGVRYIITTFPLDEKLFNQLPAIKVPPYNIPVYLYENKEARPLVYFATQVETVAPDEEMAYQKLLKEPLNNRNVFIECLDPPVGRTGCPQGLEVDGKGEVILEDKKNTLVRIKTDSKTSQWLIFSENHLPGWQAYLDDKKVTIYTAASVYMGVFIPAGKHQILFKYQYPYSWPKN